MADKISVYTLLDTDGAEVGLLGVAETAGASVSVSQSIRLLPPDPTKLGQWIIDKMAEEVNA